MLGLPFKVKRVPAQPFKVSSKLTNRNLNFNWNHPVRRWASSEDIKNQDILAGESIDAEETGIIEKTEQETMLYFDHVLPFRTNNWDIRQWISYIIVPDKRPEAIKAHVLSLANPKREDGTPDIRNLQISELVPMRRDGGAFVKFKVPYNYTISELNARINKNIASQSSKGILNYLTQSTAFPVKGSPWIEDLRRYPNKTIKVKFEGPSLTEEELYSLFRRYGTIIDIEPSSTVATVSFRSFRGAICSKNCITGLKLNDTVLHIQYDKYNQKNVIIQTISNHSKISIPLILALLTGVAVAVFDPIREFFIENKITKQYSLNWNSAYFKWITDFTQNTLSSLHRLLGQDQTGFLKKALWSERVDLVKELKLWIEENANTFIIVKGPRGTGKHELVVQHALHDRKEVLYIDCDKLVKSRNDADFISNAAHSLGYFPVFPWLNSFGNIIDLAVQGLTGQKSGFSESKESQYRGMLSTALVAIRRISLRGYKAVIGSGDNAVAVKEEDFLQQHPDKKPVIVIDRFTGSRRSESNEFVYKELADWASVLVSMNLAHVIFLTEDVGASQVLTEALPDQVFKNLSLSDASKESAKSYVLSQLTDRDPEDNEAEDEKKQISLERWRDISSELDSCLEPIGGRMLDLQAFVRRVLSGESPPEALTHMVSQTAEQITQMFLNKDQGLKNAQAWTLIKLLADKDSIRFKDLINHNLFKSSPESSLIELERQGLITITRDRGILDQINPSKPLYSAAFKSLVDDEKLSKVLETSFLYRLISHETAKIQKLETELQNFSWFSQSKEFKSRIQFISNKIEVSQQSISNAEAEIKKLAKD